MDFYRRNSFRKKLTGTVGKAQALESFKTVFQAWFRHSGSCDLWEWYLTSNCRYYMRKQGWRMLRGPSTCRTPLSNLGTTWSLNTTGSHLWAPSIYVQKPKQTWEAPVVPSFLLIPLHIHPFCPLSSVALPALVTSCISGRTENLSGMFVIL